MSDLKNVGVSIKQRLLNKARSQKRPLNELMQYYVMERFLYRLSESPLRDLFILKGAMLLRTWEAGEFRPTMDIDFLGLSSNQEELLTQQMRRILLQDVPDDGLVFVVDSIETERITEDASYHGIRVKCVVMLDSAKLFLKIDIGFDDVVFPEAEMTSLPVLLGHPSPKLLGYSKESVVAEKLEAMIFLGRINSRMKDFYDIWFLSRRFSFDAQVLSEAIKQTFFKRKTTFSTHIDAFSPEFAKEKHPLWNAFRNRNRLFDAPEDFVEVVLDLKTFLEPVLNRLKNPNNES